MVFRRDLRDPIPDLARTIEVARLQLPTSVMASTTLATTKHQLAIPYVLLPASRSLAAIHSARSRILNPTESTCLTSTHCSECGSYFFNGNGELHLVRSKTSTTSKSSRKEKQGSSPIRVLRRSCRECGHVDDMPVDRGNAALFTRTRKGRKTQKTVTTPSSLHTPLSQAVEHSTARSLSVVSSNPRSTNPTPAPAPALGPAPSQSSTLPAMPSRSKPRPKKKSGLQDMLSRNREKEERDRAKKGEGTGLASFLSSL